MVDWWIECRLVDQPDGSPRQVSDQHEYLQSFPPLHLQIIVNQLWREKRECRVLPAVDLVTPLFSVCSYICYIVSLSLLTRKSRPSDAEW